MKTTEAWKNGYNSAWDQFSGLSKWKWNPYKRDSEDFYCWESGWTSGQISSWRK